MRGWERLVVGLFGLGLTGIHSGVVAVDVPVRAFGWFVVLAALGVVEVAMALYHRRRRAARAR